LKTSLNMMDDALTSLQRYVHVTGVLHDKFVEFDFSIGDPTLHVALVLPFGQFSEFCRNNRVEHLTSEQSAAVEFDKLKWRHGDPGFGYD